MTACLEPGPGEGLAVRPDPVGDHLLLRELSAEPGMLHRAVDHVPDADVQPILAVLTRAGQNDEPAAAGYLAALVGSRPSRWRPLLEVAARQAGNALVALEDLIVCSPSPVPLDEISEEVPFSSLGLYDLGLRIDIRRLDLARQAGSAGKSLAELLIRVSRRARNAGDRDAALASITEAVDIRRRLAQANPAAFLPDLATSLNNLSNQQSNTGDRDAASVRWTTAIAAMPSDGARAELTAAWARWLADHDELVLATERLRVSAADADKPPGEDADRGQLIVVVRARQAIRDLAERLGTLDGLPRWATAPLRDEHTVLLNTVASGDWPAISEALRGAAAELPSTSLEDGLVVVEALYPGHPAPNRLRALRDEIHRLGLEETLHRHQVDHDRHALLAAWIGTTTWTDSLDFLRRHAAELETPEVRDLLAASTDPTARQHLAILDLTWADSVERTIALITDADHADEAALDAVESGDLGRLATIALASQALGQRPATINLVTAIFAAVNGDPAQATTAIADIGRSGTPLERRALAVRLRSLLRHRPDLAALAPAVRSLTDEEPPSPAPE